LQVLSLKRTWWYCKQTTQMGRIVVMRWWSRLQRKTLKILMTTMRTWALKMKKRAAIVTMHHLRYTSRVTHKIMSMMMEVRMLLKTLHIYLMKTVCRTRLWMKAVWWKMKILV
jgi:hypothetical protein